MKKILFLTCITFSLFSSTISPESKKEISQEPQSQENSSWNWKKYVKFEFLLKASDRMIGYGLTIKNFAINSKALEACYKKEQMPIQKYLAYFVPASEDLRERIHKLCVQLSMNPHEIEVALFKPEHPYNGIAAADTWKKTVLVGQKFLKNSLLQQDAVLAHELVHIKYQDNRHKAWLKLILPFLIVGSCYGASALHKKLSSFIDKKLISEKLRSYRNTVKKYTHQFSVAAESLVKSAIVHYLLITLFSIYYARWCEMRADIESAKYAGSAQGLIEFFTTYQEDDTHYRNQTYEEINKNFQGYKKLYYTFSSFLYWFSFDWFKNMHPTYEQRIAYLRPYTTEI